MTAVPAAARTALDRFSGRRVLVVGDVMLDRFIWGDVERISPEAPVPVVRVRRESTRLGGAANVAANLVALGARAVVAGAVGRDENADRLRRSIAESGIEAVLVEVGDRETTVKTRVIARAQQVVRVDRETDGLLQGKAREELVSRVIGLLQDVDAVAVSDYDKGVVTRDLLQPILSAARSRDLPVVVDPKIVHFRDYQPITVLTPNQAEAERATATKISTDAECLAAADAILEMLDSRAVLVTRGGRGMLLRERQRDPVWIPAVAREVYDVTGAGDTVVAVLALALSAGAGLADAAILANVGIWSTDQIRDWFLNVANVAGGIAVSKVGTAAVSLPELCERAGHIPENP